MITGKRRLESWSLESGIKVFSFLLILVLIGGCAKGVDGAATTSDGSKSPIKIGLIGPMTGSSAIYGKWGVSGAQFALNEMNGFTLITEDSTCDSKVGISAITKLIDVDNVDVIISDDCSTPTVSYVRLAQQKGVPVIVTTAVAKSIEDAGDYVFRTRHTAADVGSAITDFARNKNWNRAAVLYQDTDSGTTTLKEIEQKFTGEIVAKEKYGINEVDFRSQLTKIKDSQPDVLILFTQGDTGALLLKQIKEIGLSVPIIGEGAQIPPNAIKAAGQAAEGLYATFPQFDMGSCKSCSDFKESFKSKTGEDASYFAAITYDTVKLIANSSAKCGHDRACIRNALASTRNYPGVSAKITFDEKGELLGSRLGVKQVKNGIFEEVND